LSVKIIRKRLTQRTQRYKDHKEEGRGGFCPGAGLEISR